MKSLERRLHLGLTLSLSLLIAGAWWLGHAALHRSADALLISRLHHDTEALFGALRVGRDGHLSLPIRQLSPAFDQPYSGHYFSILSAGGELIRSRSLWDQSLEVRPLEPGAREVWRAEGPMGQPMLILGTGYRRNGVNVAVAVAEDISPIATEVAGFENTFALIALVGLILMVMVQRGIVRRAFARLQPIYRDIERLESGATGALTEDVPAEILPLVRKINGLLAIYARRLERSRNAVGNLAHALKGPLNLLLQQIDDPRMDAALREEIRGQIERLGRLLERELRRARLAGGVAAGAHFDPDAELTTLTRLLGQMYPQRAIETDCRVDAPECIGADREDMLELLGNLLENAFKWAHTRVRCRIESIPDGVRFIIEDDGPGCSDEALAAILERGVRLDEAVEGHGLGLAIAREIVGLYSGRLTLGRSESLGGFRALVELPVRYRARGARV